MGIYINHSREVCQQRLSKLDSCNVATYFVTPYAVGETKSKGLWPEFGRWMRDLREARHLSQSGAAQRAGIDRQQWYRIENGKSGTRRETVIAMANAVSANVDEALRRAGFSSIRFIL